MPDLLQRITTGRTSAPPRLLVYGTEGIGKSTLEVELFVRFLIDDV